MAPRTTFANLADGLQSLSLFDRMFADAGNLGVIPCQCTGTNTLVLTPIATAYSPTQTAYSNYYLYSFVAAATSTGAITINVAGLGAKTLYIAAGVAAGSDSLVISNFYTVAYSSTVDGFFFTSSGGSALPLPPYVVGDVIVATSTSALGRLADVAVGSFLASGGVGALPVYRAIVGSDLPNPTTITLGGVFALPVTNNQVLSGIGTDGVPTRATLTGTAGTAVVLATSPTITTANFATSFSFGGVKLYDEGGSVRTLYKPDLTATIQWDNTFTAVKATTFTVASADGVTNYANFTAGNLSLNSGADSLNGVHINQTGGYNVIYAPGDQRLALQLGPSGDPNNYYKATAHNFSSSDGLTTYGIFGASAFNLSLPVIVTSSSANALAVGRQGTTTPALLVNASTASCITGMEVVAAAASGGVDLRAIGETNVNVRIDARGSGTITLNGTGTGAVISARDITIDKAAAAINFGTTGNVTARLTAFGNSGILDIWNSGGRMMRVNGAASAVNYLNIQGGAAAGGSPAISAAGTDTNIALPCSSKGSGIIGWYTDSFSALQVQFTHTASANRSVTLTGSNGGNPTIGTSAGNLAISVPLVLSQTTLLATSVALTNGAAASVGTLTNAPAAGDPTKWIPIDDNGTTRYIPAW